MRLRSQTVTIAGRAEHRLRAGSWRPGRSRCSRNSCCARPRCSATALSSRAADARSMKWARSGDALTLDPHAQNEGPTTSLNQHIYEPLIDRDQPASSLPPLAIPGSVTDDPTVWEFKLRQGVKFHDGAPFNADDVVFSLERAMQPTSDIKGYLTSVEKVIKVDDLTVHDQDQGAEPAPGQQPHQPVHHGQGLGREEQRHQAAGLQEQGRELRRPQRQRHRALRAGLARARREDGDEAQRRLLGQAASCRSRSPSSTYTPIKADATRVAALLSGEVDFVQDVPVQDIERLKNAAEAAASTSARRTAPSSSAWTSARRPEARRRQGQEPVRRQARAPGHQHGDQPRGDPARVMRGQSVPAGVIMPPFVNGWTKELDARPRPTSPRPRRCWPRPAIRTASR